MERRKRKISVKKHNCTIVFFSMNVASKIGHQQKYCLSKKERNEFRFGFCLESSGDLLGEKII